MNMNMFSSLKNIWLLLYFTYISESMLYCLVTERINFYWSKNAIRHCTHDFYGLHSHTVKNWGIHREKFVFNNNALQN